MRWLAVLLVATGTVLAQDSGDAERQALSAALQDAGASPVDFIRALEGHIEKYPETSRRAELERGLVKAAMEAEDDGRILRYGLPVLEREPDDLQVLDRVTRALVTAGGEENGRKALDFARRYETLVRDMQSQEPPGRTSPAEWREQTDRGIARALVLQARASAAAGEPSKALELAGQSYTAYPTAEAARAAAASLIALGRKREAIARLADAFTLVDPRNTEEDRETDRRRMGVLHRELHGNETGLGDIVLAAYDRTRAAEQERRAALDKLDPNRNASNVLDFRLSALQGGYLDLKSLRGKTVVFDFWATWCGPCRVQHPLYEQVKQKFNGNGDVVFLSVSTDEDRSKVAPFVRENNWSQSIYFEDGLARSLSIRSIPTTIVVDRRGEIFSRMNGFLPDRFVDMLSERIEEALVQ